MPCRSEYEPEDEIQDLRKRLNTLTQMMCATGTDAQERGYLPQMRGDFKHWWEQHKIEDARRKQYEQDSNAMHEIGRKAMDKLTSEELAILKRMNII